MVNIVDEYGFKTNEEEIIKYIDFLDGKLDNKKDLSLVFLRNEEIKNLNNEFRGKDTITDVLSFEELEDDYLGDILIAIDVMKKQAVEYNHSEKRELFFLITHGYLHLNKYDHQTKEDEKIMFAKQEKLLSEYGIER